MSLWQQRIGLDRLFGCHLHFDQAILPSSDWPARIERERSGESRIRRCKRAVLIYGFLINANVRVGNFLPSVVRSLSAYVKSVGLAGFVIPLVLSQPRRRTLRRPGSRG